MPTVTGDGRESPPGAGFDTIKFNVAGAVSAAAGITASKAVELRIVVERGVDPPCNLAVVAVKKFVPRTVTVWAPVFIGTTGGQTPRIVGWELLTAQLTVIVWVLTPAAVPPCATVIFPT